MLLHLDEIEHGEDVRYKHNGERYLFFGNVDLSTATSYHNNLITWTPEEEKPLNLGINLGYREKIYCQTFRALLPLPPKDAPFAVF